MATERKLVYLIAAVSLSGAVIPICFNTFGNPLTSLVDLLFLILVNIIVVVPFLAFAVSAHLWRQNRWGLALLLIASIVAVLMGSVGWWKWGQDPEDLDMLTPVFVVPLVQGMIWWCSWMAISIFANRRSIH